MDFNVRKLRILRGSVPWRVVIRAMFFVVAMVVVSFTRIANEYKVQSNEQNLLNFVRRSLNVESVGMINSRNLTVSMIKEVMRNEMLSLDAKGLVLGESADSSVFALRELGFKNAVGVYRNTILSLFRKQLERKLDFDADSFDFVFSTSLSVPSVTVLEIERVLRPGGVGAMLVGPTNSHTRSLVISATPVSLLLRNSEIIHVCGINSSMLIVFKKQLQNVAFFNNYKLPNDCPSITKNRPLMKHLEPVEESHELSYLPKFMNISSRKRLIFINMGAGEFDKRYPIHPDSFNVYVVDHNVSVLTSHVKKPGVTFVYHPGLVEDDKTEPSLMSVDYLEAPLHEEQFEFIDWFKETAKDGDFVVLMMNAGGTAGTQLKVVVELFASGAICLIDEMFLRCSDGVDCASLYNGLRNAGVFVHRWLGN